MPEATAGIVGPSVVEATVTRDALEPKEANPMMAEEQMLPLEALLGMVRPAIRPKSPPMVPQATTEEDEVEEIKHAEPQLQSVQIIYKCGYKVVVIEEENTTREMKRLKTTVVGVMKQIEVSTATEMLVHVIGDRSSTLALYIYRG